MGGVNHGSGLVQLAANPYAAMPSLHAADALIVGITMALVCRHWWSKTIWLLWPAWVWFAVMATGNHFWLDILAGIVVAALAAVVIYRRPLWRRLRPAARTRPERRVARGRQVHLHRRGAAARVALDDRARAHARDAVDAHRRGRDAVRRSPRCSSTSSTGTSGSSSGPARSSSRSARCSTSSTARWRGQAASRPSFGAFLDSTTDRIGEAFMLGAIARRARPRRQRDGAAVHLRGDGRLVPRLATRARRRRRSA